MFYRIPETRSEGLGEGFSPKSKRRSDAPHAISLDNAWDIDLFLFCYTYVSKIQPRFNAKYPDTERNIWMSLMETPNYYVKQTVSNQIMDK